MSTTTETVPVQPAKPKQQHHYGRAALVGCLAAAIAVGGYIANDQHQRTVAEDAVAHTVTLPDNSTVVVRPGDQLPASVRTALADKYEGLHIAVQLLRVTGSHVLLVEATDGARFVGIDPLASGSSIVSASTPVAELALAGTQEYAASHTEKDGYKWQIVDLTH